MTATTVNQFRVEEDALGNVQVPAEHLWGAQTQRSHMNFPIGVERFRWGRPVLRALGILKKCAALANGELGQLSKEKVELIVRAAQEVIDGRWDDEFPLVVFQTGSGTQTNMLRRTLQRSAYTPNYAEQMGAVIALTGRLVDLAANLKSPTRLSGDDLEQIRVLAQNVCSVRSALLADGTPLLNAFQVTQGNVPHAIPLLTEMEQTVKLMDI